MPNRRAGDNDMAALMADVRGMEKQPEFTPLTVDKKRSIYRLARVYHRWDGRGRLGGALTCYSDEQIDRALAKAAMRRGDLFAAAKGNARHRRRLGKVMRYFGIDPERMAEERWPEVKRAERICLYCSKADRCQSWVDGAAPDDAPRNFCRSVALFDEIVGLFHRKAS